MKNLRPLLDKKHFLLNAFSIIMIVVLMFQPFYSIITETAANDQDISLIDNDLNDCEGDDSQEEETEENKEELCEFNQFENFDSSEKNRNSITLFSNLEHWNEHILGVITPPPEIKR